MQNKFSGHINLILLYSCNVLSKSLCLFFCDVLEEFYNFAVIMDPVQMSFFSAIYLKNSLLDWKLKSKEMNDIIIEPTLKVSKNFSVFLKEKLFNRFLLQKKFQLKFFFHLWEYLLLVLKMSVIINKTLTERSNYPYCNLLMLLVPFDYWQYSNYCAKINAWREYYNRSLPFLAISLLSWPLKSYMTIKS